MAIFPSMHGGFPGQTPPFFPVPGGAVGPLGAPLPMPGGLQGPLGAPSPMPGGLQGPLGAPMQGGAPQGGAPAAQPGLFDRIGNLAANPLFSMGMGLLAAGQDSRINAPQAAMQGLLQANQLQQQQAEAERERQRMELLAQQEARQQAIFESQQEQIQRERAAGERIRGILEKPEEIQGMPDSVRESIGLLAETDPKAAVDALTRYRLTQEGKLGTYNPRDYTAESWAKYLETGDPRVLERWNPFKVVETAHGRVLMNTSQDATDPFVMQIDTTEDQARATQALKFAETMGTKQANGLIDAAAQAGDLDLLDAQLSSIMSSSAFPAAVGAFELRGRLGKLVGSETGVLREHVTRISNALVSTKVADWKGAISDKELEFFKESVPTANSSDETWRYWYENEFKPFKAYVDAKAAGTWTGPDWVTLRTQMGGQAAGGAAAAAQYDDPELMDLLEKYGQ